MVVFWTIASFFLATFLVFTAFPMVMMLKGAEKAGVRIPRGIRTTGKIWYVVGAISDVVFNTVPAWLIFGKVEFIGVTFSQRIQEYVSNKAAYEEEWHEAIMWALFLNFCDPDHITIPSK